MGCDRKNTAHHKNVIKYLNHVNFSKRNPSHRGQLKENINIGNKNDDKVNYKQLTAPNTSTNLIYN